MGSSRRRLYSGLLLVLLGVLAACGQPARPTGSNNQNTGGVITLSPARPQVEAPRALARKEGLVALRMGGVRGQAVGDKVQLRFLVVALNADDFGLPTWKSILDRVGAAYDVLIAQDTPLTPDSLVGADGVGKYNGILLTNNSLLYQDSSGNFLSAFDGTEWNTLWDYERNYKVRQVSLYTSYGTFPEDYCLRPVGEGGVGATPLNATLTATGAKIFNELKTNVQVPITYSYVYSSAIAAGCTATSILTSGGSVLGVLSPSTDGRERLALTFSSNQYLLQSNLLTYGLLRWAGKGVFLGERKNYLNVDVDDWFNTGDERRADGTFVPNGYRMSAQDAWSAYVNQETTVLRYWNALSSFYLNIAYNAGDANLAAPSNLNFFFCDVRRASPDPLTSTSRCLRNGFRWINHTLSHPKLNDPAVATAAVIKNEIQENIRIGAAGNVINQNGANYASLGLRLTDKTVLKTGEYSGLGVYNPDPNNDIDPPTDYGLMASNPNLLSEAKAYGIKYLHGNMSFKSQQPGCFNCGIVHPMEPSLLVVPDWPTNIAYLATKPDEEASIYNCFFGPNGTCAGGTLRYWPQDLTYAQVVEAETDIALQHVLSGSAYTHTLHAGNLREYSPGKNLAMDWVGRLTAKYTTYYSTPLRSLDWNALGQYVAYRTGHFGTLAGTTAVWDRALNQVSVSSSVPGTLYLTGATGAGAASESYGGNTISRLTLAAGTPVTLTPAAYVSTLGTSAQSLPQDLVGETPRETLR